MTAESRDTYESCEFFSCDDEAEDLYLDNEADAINEFIQNSDIDGPISLWCLENSVKVFGWKFVEWSEKRQIQAAAAVIEFLNDSDIGEGLSWGGCAPFGKEHEQAILNALKDCTPNITRCDRIASRVYKGEELLAKVRELLPELLEEGA